jgi:hypothetical protein
MGELAGAGIERGAGEGALPERQRGGLRAPEHLGLEQFRQGGLRHRMDGAYPVLQWVIAFAPSIAAIRLFGRMSVQWVST